MRREGGLVLTSLDTMFSRLALLASMNVNSLTCAKAAAATMSILLQCLVQ